jgi:hypothetical protein
VAAPGQVVLLTAGSYLPQTIPFDPAKSGSGRVVFQPASDGPVRVESTGLPSFASGLDVSAHHVVVKNITVAGKWSVDRGADDVEMNNVNAQRFFIGSVSNVRVLGGDFGPFYDADGGGGSHIWPESADSADPTNILLDGIRMHDYTIPPESGYHLDCLSIGGGTNITLRRSRFWNCNGFDAWTKPFPKSYGTNGLTFVNNVFGPNLGGTPQVVEFACADGGSTLSKILFEYNSVGGEAVVGSVPFPCTLSGSGVTFRANVLPEINSANCGKPGFATMYNVVRQHPCSRSDTAYPDSSFWQRVPVSIGCSRAVGHGDPASYPRQDFRGFLRPKGQRPDAGAYESRVSKSCKFDRARQPRPKRR